MPISSLVITLTDHLVEQRQALARWLTEPSLLLGPPQGNRVPAVLETRTLSASRERVESLANEPGVQFVDVLAVNFEDSEL